MPRSSRRIVRDKAVLAVVDIQERLLPAIFEKERVVENAVRLIKGAAVLGLPIVVTEQYAKGLGPTVVEVAEAIPGFSPLEKLTFSSFRTEGFREMLQNCGAEDVIVCGIEAHVCVTQTCLDLLDSGLTPFVAVDAVSSRLPENWRLGVERLRDAGAILVSTEMILFELLGRAGTDEFRQILPLVK